MKKLLIVLGMVILLDPIEGLAQTVDLELFTTMTNNTYDDLGRAVSSAGDINNDGYDDVLVGAPVLGRVYIYFGGPAMDNIADVVFREQTNFEAFGYSVSAGDVN